MLFNSFVFWGFFVLVLAAYRLLPHRGQNLLLLVASYTFYGYWDWRFLGLLLLSTAVDFGLGLAIAAADDRRRRKLLMVVSVATNLTVLGAFKYYGFFVAEVNSALEAIGLNSALPVLNIVLPVGISFYTFQSLSYTVDVYRRAIEPTRSFSDFALFVSFFPQLVAGPIERAGALLPQVTLPRTLSRGAVAEGSYLVIIGMFKKVVIADNMAAIANGVFGAPANALGGAEVLVGVYAFAFQIYGDFSGYSNIAQGLARLMGFRLSWNFRMPYFSTSPSDFWSRWHISLSSWLRDYLYVPLGGNRHGTAITFRNLCITMLLGGLWHGAAWTFVFWGAFHGVLLVVYRAVPLLVGGSAINGLALGAAISPRLLRALQMVLMFHLVCVSWLLFRAEDMTQVVQMLRAIFVHFSLTEYAVFAFGMLAFFVAPLVAFEYWLERRDNQLAVLERGVWFQSLVVLYCLGMLLVFPPLQRQAFIYFQF